MAWLERTSSQTLHEFVPSEGTRTYTVEVDVNGNSPVLHTPGVIALALILSGCLAIMLSAFAFASALDTWKTYRGTA